ncbi:MAG TPA: thiol-activated cytolysin family protein [Solimonas sp.]|nr:thiol-activated cytolysin family protein [Solimonas sp.]
MTTAIKLKSLGARRRNLSALRFPSRMRPVVKFKFNIAPRPQLFKSDIKLQKGGLVKLQALRNPGEFGRIVPSGEPTSDNKGDWACSITPWKGEITSREPAVLNPNFHLMYPGAVYDYRHIADGSYKTLGYARKPLTVNVDGVNFSKPAVKVNQPSQASIRQAIAAIKGSQKVQGGTRTYGAAFEVLSEEDLFLRTAGSGYYLGFGGSHQVDYGSTRKSHQYFIEVSQAYYTVSVDDTVNEPSDFFVTKAEQPTNPDAVEESKIDPNWVYVESVTYGRLLQVMIQSDEALETMGIDVEAHADMIVAGGEGSMSLDQRNLLKKATITVSAIGGRGDLAGKLVNSSFDELRGRIDQFFSGTDDEVPIAYGLRTLDGALVGTHIATDFKSRQCAPVATRYKVTWQDVRCIRANDQNRSGDTEETQLFVRVRAWDGKGNDLVDIEKKNANVVNTAKASKQTNGLIGTSWTFVEGSSNQPIPLDMEHPRRDFSHRHLTFKIPAGDKNAKIGIRADVVEFDDIDGDDHFADEAKTFTIAEVGSGKNVKLLCTDGGSRIEFGFRIEPIYE